MAHLDDDKEREQEKLLLDGLRDFEGVETLTVDRLLEWPTSGTEGVKKKKANEDARDLLKQTRGDALVWGSVISIDKKIRGMRLYWTPSREIKGAKETEKYPLQPETIALPTLFWSDLKQILGLLAQSRLAETDSLSSLIVQVRSLVQSKEGLWDPNTLAGVQFGLALALFLEGDQSGKNEPR